jgi:hypothetical protein
MGSAAACDAAMRYMIQVRQTILIYNELAQLIYFGLRLPWFRGRSWTKNVCLFLLYRVL